MRKIVSQQVLGYSTSDGYSSTVVRNVWNDNAITYTEYIRYYSSRHEYIREYNRELYHNGMAGEVFYVDDSN